MTMNPNQLESDFECLRTKLGRTPTGVEYEEHTKHSRKTIRKIYGSWSNFVCKITNEDVKRCKRELKECIQCKILTKNPKFCSSRCSAIHCNSTANGRITGSKSKGNKCKICDAAIPPSRNRCEGCKFKVKMKNGTYKQLVNITKLQALTKDTQKYRRIRSHARITARNAGLLKECLKCKYNLHVECAHKIPIESFADDVLIGVINAPSNLLGFCRNCHWEYDHGFLKL
jgi:hypothetical protein